MGMFVSRDCRNCDANIIGIQWIFCNRSCSRSAAIQNCLWALQGFVIALADGLSVTIRADDRPVVAHSAKGVSTGQPGGSPQLAKGIRIEM
jgi:hypothetical protein